MDPNIDKRPFIVDPILLKIWCHFVMILQFSRPWQFWPYRRKMAQKTVNVKFAKLIFVHVFSTPLIKAATLNSSKWLNFPFNITEHLEPSTENLMSYVLYMLTWRAGKRATGWVQLSCLQLVTSSASKRPNCQRPKRVMNFLRTLKFVALQLRHRAAPRHATCALSVSI